jgi:hypothetical protein
MKTKSVEIIVDDDQRRDYPNCYAAIPANGKVCPHTGLRHAQMYVLLSKEGAARPFVRVANLRQPRSKKGKTLFHVGDFLHFLDRLADAQESGNLRTP